MTLCKIHDNVCYQHEQVLIIGFLEYSMIQLRNWVIHEIIKLNIKTNIKLLIRCKIHSSINSNRQCLISFPLKNQYWNLWLAQMGLYVSVDFVVFKVFYYFGLMYNHKNIYYIWYNKISKISDAKQILISFWL